MVFAPVTVTANRRAWCVIPGRARLEFRHRVQDVAPESYHRGELNAHSPCLAAPPPETRAWRLHREISLVHVPKLAAFRQGHSRMGGIVARELSL